MTMQLPQTLDGFPPENVVFPVHSVDLKVLDGPHPWVSDHAEAIAENWLAECRANPHLYDGPIVLQRWVGFSDGHLVGRGHMAGFSSLLHWRRQKRAAGACHLFAMPLILSGDGALIAIRMAETTANPGRVYCAAGSLDDQDVIDGRCDLDLNMRREVAEETGLDLDAAEVGAHFFATRADNTVTLFRTFRFAQSAAALVSQIAAHAAAEDQPEIAEALAIFDADPQAHDYAFFMHPILKWLFAQQEYPHDQTFRDL